MNLQIAYDRLNFWINKKTGAWYSPEELDDTTDSGQMSLYADLQPLYATSERIKDALAPFRRKWDFTPADTISGIIPIPSNLDFLNLLDVRITYDISGRTRHISLEFPNEDELSTRLDSQIDPVTITSPIGEIESKLYIRTHPTGTGYNGTVTFLRRPIKPHFVYTTISERVVVYDNVASTQLEWPENWINALLLKALNSIGINLDDQEVQQFAEMKSGQNFQNVNRT